MIRIIILVIVFVKLATSPTTPRPQNQQDLLASITNDEQRVIIKYKCGQGMSAGEISRDLQRTLGERALSQRQVRRLCHQFLEDGRIETHCLSRPGRPRTAVTSENRERVRDLIEIYDGARTESLAFELGISQTSVRTLLQDLGYTYRQTRWIPHELSLSQRENRVATARHNLKFLRTERRFLDRIIAIDETWLYSYLPSTEVGQWTGNGSTPAPRVRQTTGDWKIMAIVAFYQNRVLTYTTVEQGQTVTGEVFGNFLRSNLAPAISNTRIPLPFLLMDNARVHFTPNNTQIMRDNGWTLLRQDAYSPDQNPCDSHGFRHLKQLLRSHTNRNGGFDAVPILLQALDRVISDMNYNNNFRGITELPATWEAIIREEGKYVH